MKEVVWLIQCIVEARGLRPVILIVGESGVGKELVARALHEASTRRGKPFIKINPCATPADLFDTAAFGHVKGAFTGAHQTQPGWFERADGGTLFLDEVGELSLAMQVKLLRVIETGEIQKVGARGIIHTDVQLICATNSSVEEAVQQGRFRLDLYHRLATQIAIPPLRDRLDDIEVLFRYFIQEQSQMLNIPVPTIDMDAIIILRAHDWPGNVRELEAVARNTLIFCPGVKVITAENLYARSMRRIYAVENIGSKIEFPCDMKKILWNAEEEFLVLALHRAKGNKPLAAKLLGLSKPATYAKLSRHGIS